MFYPENFEEKIGFDALRQRLTDHCISEMGREIIHDIQYIDSFEEIQKKLLEINEFKEILLLDDPFPAQDYYDLRPTLTRIAIRRKEFPKMRISKARTEGGHPPK